MMKQNRINLTKKKYFSIAIISAIILMIFLGAYCLKNFSYNLVDEIDLEKINETDKKLLVETFKMEMKSAIHLFLFTGIILGCFVGSLVSNIFILLKSKN